MHNGEKDARVLFYAKGQTIGWDITIQPSIPHWFKKPSKLKLVVSTLFKFKIPFEGDFTCLGHLRFLKWHWG